MTTLRVDGNVFAQPLLVSGFEFADRSKRDVLIVATGHNTVYAYDAQTDALIWKRNLGVPQSSDDVFCDDVVPEYGITSTPVIVRDGPGKASIYVVAATEPNAFEFHSPLHRLDLATGADLVQPVEIKPHTTLSDGTLVQYDPSSQWTRAALAWGNNSLYVTVSSHCDNNATDISGWVLRFESKLRQSAAFPTVADPAGYKLASIWGAGFGPAMDDAGQFFAVTGNGDFDADAGGHNYGESVIALSAGLNEVRSSFTPGTYLDLNDEDRDFGSGGVMLLPPPGRPTIQPLAANGVPPIGARLPPLAVTTGKDNVLYLLDASRLGGRRPHDEGALQALRIGESGFGVRGGPAYYGGPSGATVFIQPTNAVLKSFKVSVTVKGTPTLCTAVRRDGTGDIVGRTGSSRTGINRGQSAGSGDRNVGRCRSSPDAHRDLHLSGMRRWTRAEAVAGPAVASTLPAHLGLQCSPLGLRLALIEHPAVAGVFLFDESVAGRRMVGRVGWLQQALPAARRATASDRRCPCPAAV